MNGQGQITQEQHDALDAARVLVESGVPVFVAARDAKASTGFRLPKGWQHAKCHLSMVDRWRPGMALCAVMGLGVDVVDVDPRNGGNVSLAGMRERDLLPQVYAVADTPSGGQHFFVASLDVHSRNGLLPGIDVKAGDATGTGRGFVFLAPTVKLSKQTGKPEPYRWVEPPGTALATVCLVGGDDSGAALRGLVDAGRSTSAASGAVATYDGPAYDSLSEGQRQAADVFVGTKLGDWRMRLNAAADWDEGERDEEGRGWEALARDAAWAMAALAATPWAGVSVDIAHEYYDKILPQEIANNVACAGKWSDDLVGKVGANQVDAPPWADFEPVHDDFWDETTTLAHIRQAAHSRMVSAPALLAYVLGRVLAEVPPEVVLPPVVGSPASLNFGLAVVGRSGDGKSALLATSRDLLGLDALAQADIERNVGSGEGLAQSFLVRAQNVGNVLVDDPRRIFLVDEVESLGAKQSRQGATLGADLRTMLTGGVLGQANAERDRNRHVPAGAYRAVVFAGVQPTRSAVLLQDTDAGTPQRYLWVRATDPTIPAKPPQYPGPLAWSVPRELPPRIDYPEGVKEEVRQARHRQATGGGDPVDGHRLLMRLKVATALAILHGEAEVKHQWWALAGELIAESVRVQEACRQALDDATTEASRARGRQNAIEQSATKQTHDELVEQDARRIATEVRLHATQAENARRKHRANAGCTRACVTNGLRHSKTKHRDEGMAFAMAEGWVVERDGKWHPGTRIPEKP